MRHIKSEFDKLSFKELFTFGLAAVCMAAAFVLVFIGVYMPPQGEIHPTIITIFGLCLGFAGTLLGIKNHYDIQTKKLRAEIMSMIQTEFTPKSKDNNDKENETTPCPC